MQTVHYLPVDQPVWRLGHGRTLVACASPDELVTVDYDSGAILPGITHDRNQVTCLDCLLSMTAGALSRNWVQRDLALLNEQLAAAQQRPTVSA